MVMCEIMVPFEDVAYVILIEKLTLFCVQIQNSLCQISKSSAYAYCICIIIHILRVP